MPAAEPKTKRKRRAISPFTLLLIITAVLTLLAAAIVIVQTFDIQADGTSDIADAPAGELSFAYEDEEASSIHPLGSTRLIRLSKSQIDLLNLSGSIEESINTTLADPKLISTASYALIYDQGGSRYYLIDRNGLVFSGTTEDPIESVAVSGDGLISLILDRQDTNGVLRVLTEDGSLLMEWVALDSQNSGYIITSAFAADSSFIDLSLLNTNRSNSTSLLNRFSLEAGQIGERVAQYQVDGDAAIVSIINGTDKSAFISEQNIYTVHQGSLLQASHYAGIYALTAYQEGVAIVATDTVGGRYKLYCLSDLATMNPGSGLDLAETPNAAVSRGRYLAIADGEKVYLISDAQISKAEVFDLKSTVLDLGLDDKGNILVVTRHEVRRIVR